MENSESSLHSQAPLRAAFSHSTEFPIALVECLTKREVKSVNSRIEELDFEGSVYDGTFLPDELIEPGLPNFAGAIRGSVNAAIFAGSGAI